MKKFMLLMLVFAMTFSFAACGGSSDSGDGAAADTPEAEKAVEEDTEASAFGIDAVENYLKETVNLDLSAIEPDWEYTIVEDNTRTENGADEYGYAVIYFTKKDGELSREEYDEWVEKVYDATAAAAQDRKNTISWEIAGAKDGELKQKNPAEMARGWGFKYNDRHMAVQTFLNPDAEYEGESSGECRYNGVIVSIASGLQVDADEIMEDAEEKDE